MTFRSRMGTSSSGTCPMQNANREAKRGVLVSKLDIAINSAGEEVAAQPSTHVAMFAGDLPYGPDGSVYRQSNGAAGLQIGALRFSTPVRASPSGATTSTTTRR